MTITLKHLAKTSGVDVSTVSRALQNDSRVKEATRTKIKALAKKMGYQPNLAARSLVAGKTRTIWFMVPSLCHILEQIPAQHAAIYLNEKYNYDMMVALHHSDKKTYCRLIDRLTQGVADGVIIIPGPTKTGGGYVKPLLDQNYPIVFLDRHPEKVKATCVVTDNHKASYDMIKNAYQDGVEAVIDITEKYSNNASKARSKGVADACKKYKITLMNGKIENIVTKKLPKKIVIIGSAQSSIYDFMRKNNLLTQQHEIIICCFDQWFGEPYPAEKVIVAKQDFASMAEIACDMLIKMIDGKKIIEKIKIPINTLQIIKPTDSTRKQP